MANKYVYSGAGGAGTGADWANAYTTLAAAATGSAAGDDIWVAHDHAETQASAMTVTFPGSAASPNRVFCVNQAGSVPPVAADLATTATVTTTGANAMTINGFAYIYGIAFNCGTGAVSSGISLITANADGGLWFQNCALAKKGTSSAGSNAIVCAGSTADRRYRIVFRNTTVELGNTADRLNLRCDFEWYYTDNAIVGTAPAALFYTTLAAMTYLKGVDLSALTTGLFGTTQCARKYVLEDCELAGAVSASLAQFGADVYLIRTDSAGTNYRHEKYSYPGSQVVETTIVRSGGATDGTTPLAWKFVTNANAEWQEPFVSIPISVWIDDTSAKTVTIYGIWGGGAVPTNADLWIELGYLGSASVPLASLVTTGKASPLAANVNTTADGSTWGGSTTAFSMAVTFTPLQKGFVTISVRVAAVSATIYIDPKPVIT